MRCNRRFDEKENKRNIKKGKKVFFKEKWSYKKYNCMKSLLQIIYICVLFFFGFVKAILLFNVIKLCIIFYIMLCMFTLIVQYLYSTNLMKYFVLWTYKILIMTNLN